MHVGIWKISFWVFKGKTNLYDHEVEQNFGQQTWSKLFTHCNILIQETFAVHFSVYKVRWCIVSSINCENYFLTRRSDYFLYTYACSPSCKSENLTSIVAASGFVDYNHWGTGWLILLHNLIMLAAGQGEDKTL